MMKIKNIKLTLLVLACLIVASYAFLSLAEENSSTENNIFIDSDQDGLSDAEEKVYGTNAQNPDSDGDGYSDGVEVKSGFNPLKAAPEDRTDFLKISESTPLIKEKNDNNLTDKMAQIMADSINNSNNGEMSLNGIQAIVDEALAGETDISFPKIDLAEIKIKKQNYSTLPKEKQLLKRKEDFSKYAAAISYVLASNSPSPITSGNDVASSFQALFKNIATAITAQDFSSVEALGKNAEKTLGQMKNIEVPFELVDLHIKGLQFVQYSVLLQSSIISEESDDPVGYISNLAKLSGLAEAFEGFVDETQKKLDEYGFEYDDSVKEELQKLGIPDINNVPLFSEEDLEMEDKNK
jgi:hypothetical protein